MAKRSFALSSPLLWATTLIAADPAVLINEPALRESSGLVESQFQSQVFWTHNDSGGQPELFAFDKTGKGLGRWPVLAPCQDWEDLTSATIAGQRFLVIADTGDNHLSRASVQLHIVPEPDPNSPVHSLTARSITFTYPERAYNCEAIAVDPISEKILLLTKHKDGPSSMFQLSLSMLSATHSLSQPQQAEFMRNLKIGTVTGMAIDDKGKQLVVLTKDAVLLFQRQAESSNPSDFFSGPPLTIAVPRGPKDEAIAFSPDGKRLSITSESTSSGKSRLCRFQSWALTTRDAKGD